MNNVKMAKVPKQKRSRERVDLILKATLKVLETDGIKALSTNSIAARAGIPVSSIYQYFQNKEAILAGVYEKYLEEIRDSIELNDKPEDRELPWQEVFTRLRTTVEKLETRNNIDIELDMALKLYPELMEIERRHTDWMTDYLANSFKQMGSRWPRAKLKRLAHYLYEQNNATWSYRIQRQPPKNEIQGWSEAAFMAVASKCFE